MKDFGTFAVFHEDVFIEHYRPYVPRVIRPSDVYGDFELQPSRWVYNALRTIDRRCVWTIIESDRHDSRDVFYSPGFHMVNRVGYAVTHEPHNDASIVFCAYWRRSLCARGVSREIYRLRAYLRRASRNGLAPTSAVSN
jgi:hypothetical protein